MSENYTASLIRPVVVLDVVYTRISGATSAGNHTAGNFFVLPCKVTTFDKSCFFLPILIVTKLFRGLEWLTSDYQLTLLLVGWCLGKLAGKHLARPTAQLWDATKPPSHIPHNWNQFLCEAAICHTLYLHSGGNLFGPCGVATLSACTCTL